jgi:transcriptional regulator with XRE-family HTH domain
MSDFSTELERLMTARRVGVRELARQAHFTAGYISNLRSGKRRPSPETAGLLDRVLRADGTLVALSRDGRTAAGGPRAPQPDFLPLGTDLLALAWMVGRLDQRIDHRGVYGLAATASHAPVLGLADPAERISYALAHPAAGLAGDTIDYLETVSLGLHWLEFVLPAGRIFRDVLTHLNEVISLLEACSDRQQRHRLAVIAGETALLGAWVAWDLGDGGRAASMYRAAELAAAASGDRSLLACAVIYQTLAVSGGLAAHAQAREKLAGARMLPGQSDPATRAWLMTREAEEAAALGDRSAKDLLMAASEELASARPQSERSWERGLDFGDLVHERLAVAVRLGDREGVYASVRELVLQTGDPEEKRTGRELATIGLALAAIGDTAEAIKFGQRSLEAVRVSRAKYAITRLSELGATLREETRPEARELREGIRVTRQGLASPHLSRPDSLPALR